MQSVTSNQTCGEEQSFTKSCACSQSFTKSCGEEVKPCSHTNTVSWGNRFGSGINCYDCGFSLDKNRTVIPGSNMVNCLECGESVDRENFGLFDYGGSENWYCKRVCSICETVFKCGDEYDEDDLNVYCTEMCYDYFQENLPEDDEEDDAECEEVEPVEPPLVKVSKVVATNDTDGEAEADAACEEPANQCACSQSFTKSCGELQKPESKEEVLKLKIDALKDTYYHAFFPASYILELLLLVRGEEFCREYFPEFYDAECKKAEPVEPPLVKVSKEEAVGLSPADFVSIKASDFRNQLVECGTVTYEQMELVSDEKLQEAVKSSGVLQNYSFTDVWENSTEVLFDVLEELDLPEDEEADAECNEP